MRRWLGLAIVLAAATAVTTPARSDDRTHVAHSLTWRRLLHFNGSNTRSEIIDPRFFITANGHSDPEGELTAALERLQTENETTPENQAFACQFPARAHFLAQQFSLSKKFVCPTYDAWAARALPESISFVYAAQLVGNPASAFGHSFLRFDRGRHSGLLGFSLSYFAHTKTKDNPLVYAFKGLFGGYTGAYEFDNYYPKDHRYANVENRDLWEYHLALTPEQRQRVFDHAWELSHFGGTKYYFLDRNCSFQLLRLLDVADDRFNFAEATDGFFVTPIEAVKSLQASGLIQRWDYRPSLAHKAKHMYSRISEPQQRTVRDVIRGNLQPEEVSDPSVADAVVAVLAMNETKASRVSDASLFSRATSARAKIPIMESKSSLSESRSALSERSEKLNPLNSHGTSQARVGFVASSGGTNSSALEFSFRPGLHALSEYGDGFLPNTQIVYLDTSVRLESDGKAKLNAFNLLDIKSLQPEALGKQEISWSAKFSWDPMLGSSCIDCHAFSANAMIGYSVEFSRLISYSLIGPTVDTAKRAGGSLALGLISRPIYHLVGRIEERVDSFLTGPFGYDNLWTSEASITWQISRETSLAVRALGVVNLNSPARDYSEAGLRLAESF